VTANSPFGGWHGTNVSSEKATDLPHDQLTAADPDLTVIQDASTTENPSLARRLPGCQIEPAGPNRVSKETIMLCAERQFAQTGGVSNRAAAAADHQAAFAALRRTWLASLTSDRTRDAYARDLAGFHDWYGSRRSPLSARGRSFERYRSDRQAAGDQPSTLARRLSALSSFYEHALTAGEIRTNPLGVVARPTVAAGTGRVLTTAEVAALERGATQSGPRAELLVALLVREGLRLGAVLELDVEEVNERQLPRRAGSPADRPAPAAEWNRRTRRAAAAVVGTRTDGPLFVGASPTRRHDTRLTRFGADFILKQAAAAGAVRGPLSAGTLRRTFISQRHEPAP
jgi:site-specific recombinase XerD